MKIEKKDIDAMTRVADEAIAVALERFRARPVPQTLGLLLATLRQRADVDALTNV